MVSVTCNFVLQIKAHENININDQFFEFFYRKEYKI